MSSLLRVAAPLRPPTRHRTLLTLGGVVLAGVRAP